MRLVIIAVLALGCSLSAYAAEGADAKAVNTVCPVSGKTVDTSITPVSAKTTDGKAVNVGVCCDKCPAKIAKNPVPYADAAVANKKMTDK